MKFIAFLPAFFLLSTEFSYADTCAGAVGDNLLGMRLNARTKLAEVVSGAGDFLKTLNQAAQVSQSVLLTETDARALLRKRFELLQAQHAEIIAAISMADDATRVRYTSLEEVRTLNLKRQITGLSSEEQSRLNTLMDQYLSSQNYDTEVEAVLGNSEAGKVLDQFRVKKALAEVNDRYPVLSARMLTTDPTASVQRFRVKILTLLGQQHLPSFIRNLFDYAERNLVQVIPVGRDSIGKFSAAARFKSHAYQFAERGSNFPENSVDFETHAVETANSLVRRARNKVHGIVSSARESVPFKAACHV